MIQAQCTKCGEYVPAGEVEFHKCTKTIVDEFKQNIGNKLIYSDIYYGTVEIDSGNSKKYISDGEKYTALGRNGEMKQIGIAIDKENTRGVLAIKPINSKMEIGRCSMELPLKHLDRIIKALEKFRDADTENK